MSYPDELNGIISPKEFHRSIDRINRSLSPDKNFTICILIFYVTTIIGVVFSYVSIITLVSNPEEDVFLALSIVGIVLTVLGSILFIFGSSIIKRRRILQLQQAVAGVSEKYSTRSPIQCGWILEPAVSLSAFCINCSTDDLTDRVSIQLYPDIYDLFDYSLQIRIKIDRPTTSKPDPSSIYQDMYASTVPSAPPSYPNIDQHGYELPGTFTPLPKPPFAPGTNQHGVFS